MKKLLAVLTTLCIVGGSLTAIYSGSPDSVIEANAWSPSDYCRYDNAELPYDNSSFVNSDYYVDPSDSEIKPTLKIDKLEVPVSAAGTKQSVTFTISGADGKYNSTAFHVFYDNRLRVEERRDISFGSAVSDMDIKLKRINADGEIWFGAEGSNDCGEDGEYAHIDFIIPDDAAPGDLYPIGIDFRADMNITDWFSNMNNDKLIMSALFTNGIENGYIKIVSSDEEDVLKYEVYDDHAEVISCDKSAEGEIIIPDKINGVPVEIIGYGAFWGCSTLTSIKIPDSVTNIGVSAFYGCSSLKSITLPDSVRYIANGAFRGCLRLTSITMPDSVTRLDNEVFMDCNSLKSITIPDSVTSVGENAFKNCSRLESIEIPDSVTKIGVSAFYGCSSLELIMIPDSVTSIGYEAFRYCKSLTSVKIPDSVKSIGFGAFVDCAGLTEVTISGSVTSIGNYTFYGCNSLTSITIPSSVASIGREAFNGCTNLNSITIPDSVTSIENYAFNDCNSIKIKGYSGSYAETYANENNIPFVPLGESPTSGNELKKGDANGDGDINMSDVVIVMQASLNPKKYGVNGTSPDRITAEGEKVGDVDGKEGLSANDALIIQRYSLKLIDTL